MESYDPHTLKRHGTLKMNCNSIDIGKFMIKALPWVEKIRQNKTGSNEFNGVVVMAIVVMKALTLVLNAGAQWYGQGQLYGSTDPGLVSSNLIDYIQQHSWISQVGGKSFVLYFIAFSIAINL